MSECPYRNREELIGWLIKYKRYTRYRADKLSDTHNKISKDSGGNDMSYDMKNIYHQSKSIILDAIENIFLDKVVKIKGKQDYKSLNSVKNSVETMNSFSKWLAKRKKKNL